jgi:acetyl esterase/lipase
MNTFLSWALCMVLAAATAGFAASCGGATGEQDDAGDTLDDPVDDAADSADRADDADAVDDAASDETPVEDLIQDQPEEDVVVIPDDPGETGPRTWSESVEEGVPVEEGMFPETADLSLFIPDGDGPFPVVVFTHGFMLGPGDYMSYGRHLASWGYVVVMPQMPSGIIPPNHRALKEYLIKILDWIDENAANPDGPLLGRADASRLGLSGHSMGGKISLLVCTEDIRPTASFTVDPVDAAGTPVVINPADYPSVTPELMDQIIVPLGLSGETVNATAEGQACAPEEDNFHQYYLYAVTPAVEIEVLGANHVSFLDNPDCGLVCNACSPGTDDPAVTRRLTQKHMTAFYNLYLYGQTGYRAYLAGGPMDDDAAAGLVLYDTKNGF